jgi:hypothetical protein
MTLSIPYTLVNNTNADATKVQANFAEIASYVNTNAVLKDGSVTFTGIPSLPATDPTTANQAVRKSYVDAQIAAGTAVVGGDLTGTVANAQIAAAAVGVAEIAAAVAGNGLAGGAGTALSVNVDGSTLEINTDSLRVKDLGITNAKLVNTTYANIKGIASYSLCGRATASSAQTIMSGTPANLTFATEDYDYSAMHDTGSRVTVATAGVYQFSATVPWAGSIAGYRSATIKRFNSSNVLQTLVAQHSWDAGDSSTSTWVSNCAGSCLMAVGDYVVVEVDQNTGSNLDVIYGFGQGAHLEWNCVRVS